VEPPLPPLGSLQGNLRIWTKDADELRAAAQVAEQDGGDFICGDETEYTAAALGLSTGNLTVTYYVEAVKPSQTIGDLRIQFFVKLDEEDETWYSEAVRVTAVMHNLVASFTIGEETDPVEMGTAVPIPFDEDELFRKQLQASHLLFPPNCLIDDTVKNMTYGLIRLSPGFEDAVVLLTDDEQECVPVTQEVAEAFELDTEEVDAGVWWQTPAYTETGLQSPIQVAAVDGENHHLLGSPIQALVKQPMAIVQLTETPTRFEKYEAEIVLDDDYFHHLGTDDKGLDQIERFDAYDADGNHAKIKADARFTLMSGGDPDEVVDDHDYDVPCFPMKESAESDFKWLVRFSPPRATDGDEYWELTVRAVVWHNGKADTENNYDEFNIIPESDPESYYHYYGYNEYDDQPVFPYTCNQHKDENFYAATNHFLGITFSSSLPVPRLTFLCSASAVPGPLRFAQVNKTRHYLYRDAPATEPVFLVGLAKPWDRQYEYPSYASGPEGNWEGMDLVDRDAVFSDMAEAGMNFNYSWFAPWECQLVHNGEPSEFWYVDNVRQEPNIVPEAEWRGYSYYDQGRAARMDQIIQDHEAHNVYLALNIWSHQALQDSSHHWGETGWNQRTETEENGFSSLHPGETGLDEFFAAAHDIEGAHWLWQKNYYRYITARWGHSRAIVLWVLLDELEGSGRADAGYYSGPTYWWRHSGDTFIWHDELVKVVRSLDWSQRPLTTSATYWNYHINPYAESERNNHGDWIGHNEQIDMLSHHVYHKVWFWEDGEMKPKQTNGYDPSWDVWSRLEGINDQHARIWHALCGRMFQWAANTADKQKPWLVTEYGLFERRSPSQFTAPLFERRLARSYLHFAIWSAFISGHSGTPLKWCDGLNYGEMFPRGSGPFQPGQYPDLRTEVQKLKGFVSSLNLDVLKTKAEYEVKNNGDESPVRCWALRSPSTIVAWLFDDHFEREHDASWGTSTRTYTNSIAASKEDHDITFTDVTPYATFTVNWYNTWDGGLYYDTKTKDSDGNGTLTIEVGTLATTSRDPSEAWDGADAILVIEEVQ